jgi:broad specificity phosphatase PhoE
MKHLILVKHSLPSILEDIPAREWILSEIGKTRAQELAERLAPYQPEIIVSSIEPKAIQTAEIVAHSLNLNMTVVENLHEHDRGNIGYLSQDAFQTAIRKFFDVPNKLVFGRETADQSHQRFRDAVCSVLDNHQDQTVMVVAHGTVISLFVSRLLGISAFSLWHELGLPSFVVLDMKSNALITKENVP